MAAGRPTLFNPQICKAICEAISVGMPEAYAATSQGINPLTLKRWKKKYVTFCADVKRARAEAMQRRIKRIEKAGKDGTWQADAWYLERQFFEEFGLNRKEIQELLKFAREYKKEHGK